MKRISILLVLAMLVSTLFTGCQGTSPASGSSSAGSKAESGAAAPTGDNDPFGKYDPAITLTVIRSDSQRTFMPGETLEDNIWTRTLEEELGIKLEYSWIAASSEFDAKLNLAIATDDLADMMAVPYDSFYRMAKADKLADLTDAYANYADDVMRGYLEMSEGLALSSCTIDDKLYALGVAPDLGMVPMLWYRNDWAENVGITEKPKSMEDVIEMAYKFTNEDPNGDGSKTVGIGVSNDFLKGGLPMEGFFAAYGAYPTIWVKEGDKLVFGGTQEVTKEVLALLQQFYADGVIDNDFINKGAWQEAPDDIVKGRIGMAFGLPWFGDWQTGSLLKSAGWDATWTSMLLPASGGGVASQPVNVKQNSVLCSAKGNEYPEAIVKIINLKAKMLQSDDAVGELHDQIDPDGNIVNNFFHIHDITANAADNTTWNYRCAQNVTAALENNDPTGLTSEELSYYNRSVSYLNKEDEMGYNSYLVFGPEGSQHLLNQVITEGHYTKNAFSGPNTDAMNDKWGNIDSKLKEVFARIIMGSDIDTEWSAWIDFFNSQGGEQITQEVNDWAKNG